MAIAFGLTLSEQCGIKTTLSKERCALHLQRNISGGMERDPQLLLQLCYYDSCRNAKLGKMAQFQGFFLICDLLVVEHRNHLEFVSLVASFLRLCFQQMQSLLSLAES